MSITCTVDKKENALIIHSAMETWNMLLSEISSFYVYALFRKFRTHLDLEPATPLLSETFKKGSLKFSY